MIAIFDRWFDYVGDEWGKSLVINVGLSIVEGLDLFDYMLEQLS